LTLYIDAHRYINTYPFLPWKTSSFESITTPVKRPRKKKKKKNPQVINSSMNNANHSSDIIRPPKNQNVHENAQLKGAIMSFRTYQNKEKLANHPVIRVENTDMTYCPQAQPLAIHIQRNGGHQASDLYHPKSNKHGLGAVCL
jgi:hypothetical protein